MHSQQPPGVVQNWSTLQCSKQNTEQCGYDHAPVTRGRMRARFPLPHGPPCQWTPLSKEETWPRPDQSTDAAHFHLLNCSTHPGSNGNEAKANPKMAAHNCV